MGQPLGAMGITVKSLPFTVTDLGSHQRVLESSVTLSDLYFQGLLWLLC